MPMTSTMYNISLLMSQQFRTNSSVLGFCILYYSDLLGNKIKCDVIKASFQNVTSLVTSLRNIIAIKILCFRYKRKTKTSEVIT